MKRLKLFPKTFFYTLAIMVFVIGLAHILMYLLAPKMDMVISTTNNTSEEIVVGIREEKIVIQAVQKALPFSLICCLVISVICSLLFSKAIVDPIERISTVSRITGSPRRQTRMLSGIRRIISLAPTGRRRKFAKGAARMPRNRANKAARDSCSFTPT